MVPELVLNAATAEHLRRLNKHPPHAVLLVAPEGFGKRAVAENIAAGLLKVADAAMLRADATYHVVVPEKTGVTIDAVRELHHFAKLKTAGGVGHRVAIIEQAHTMSAEAQNAALKLLEEPPAGMVLLLTATTDQAMLPTIRSRVQTMRLKLPGRQAVTDHFAALGHDAADVERAAMLSGGLPGLMSALLGQVEHPLLQTVEQARGLLRADTLERLGMVDAAAKSREEAVRLCAMLQRMAAAALHGAAAKGSQPAVRQWHRVLAAGYDAEQALRQKAQPKLVMTNLALGL